MHNEENRTFANDSWMTAVVRVVFFKWMQHKRKWIPYMQHLKRYNEMEVAWNNPDDPYCFLSRCSFGYHDAYKPWVIYCAELCRRIQSKIYEYDEDYQGH